jgi:anti-sigma28 factor (negative regulator of flagellin synthesis)
MSILIKLAIIAALIASAIAYVAHRDHMQVQEGYNKANAEWGAFNSRESARKLRDQLAEQKKAQDSEHTLAVAQAKTEAEHQHQLELKNEKIKQLNAAIADGRLRLSIAVSSRGREVGSGDKENPAAPGTPDGVQRADIVPEAANRIIAITADGDRMVSERNECIRLYNQVMAEYNKD